MKNFIALLFASAILVSCKKVTELPPATQSGANTFGALVDGGLWVPEGFGPFPANDILSGHYLPGRDLMLNARNFRNSPNESEFEIYVKNVRTPGVYHFNTDIAYPNQRQANYAYFVRRNVTPVNEWITSSTHQGTITFTRVDTVNKIVSGTFQFNAINLYNAPQPISVTEGRFDITLQ